MAAAAPVTSPQPPSEQRILLHGISWKDYSILRDVLDGPGVFMTYERGTLELMKPSREHEMWKKNIARLVELYAHLLRIDLRGYGSTTFKSEAKARGVEPDECYLLGRKLADCPDIALEVIHTSPLLDKLEIYAAFGVPEVWVFRDGAFTIHGLDRATSRYVPRARSAFLPDLDFALIARLGIREDTPQALRELEDAVRAK
jgi:Uma2 family endonuclease